MFLTKGVTMDNGAGSYLRFLNGDNDAFVELVREYNDKLVLFLNTVVNDIHISEEAADETFLKLYTARPVYKQKYSFKTWLYTIGKNTALNYLKRLKKGTVVPIEDVIYLSDEVDIEEEYIKDEQNIRLHHAIKALKSLVMYTVSEGLCLISWVFTDWRTNLFPAQACSASKTLRALLTLPRVCVTA